MSDALHLSAVETDQSQRRYGPPRSANPAYLVLLALVLIVGSASTIAWYFGNFSLEERAIRGDANAQYLLGKRYFDSAMSARDYARAARLIRQAANQGYARAQAGLGLLYENGLGVPKNYVEALTWLRRAAGQGYSVAQNELGIMYAKGRGVPRDLEEAAKWCRLAAVQGSEVARRNLALAEVAKSKIIPELAGSGKKIYKRAVVQKVEGDGVTIGFVPVHGGFGVAKLKLDDLPSDLKELCKYATKQGPASDSAYSQIGAIATPL